MAEAIREAYSDLFTIKAKPANADRELIEGKFKSTHNASPNTAKLMASTFYALLDLADLSARPEQKVEIKAESAEPTKSAIQMQESPSKRDHRPSLHYNIQIHLPATKDIEVFNAIFKSLKEHLLD